MYNPRSHTCDGQDVAAQQHPQPLVAKTSQAAQQDGIPSVQHVPTLLMAAQSQAAAAQPLQFAFSPEQHMAVGGVQQVSPYGLAGPVEQQLPAGMYPGGQVLFVPGGEVSQQQQQQVMALHPPWQLDASPPHQPWQQPQAQGGVQQLVYVGPQLQPQPQSGGLMYVISSSAEGAYWPASPTQQGTALAAPSPFALAGPQNMQPYLLQSMETPAWQQQQQQVVHVSGQQQQQLVQVAGQQQQAAPVGGQEVIGQLVRQADGTVVVVPAPPQQQQQQQQQQGLVMVQGGLTAQAGWSQAMVYPQQVAPPAAGGSPGWVQVDNPLYAVSPAGSSGAPAGLVHVQAAPMVPLMAPATAPMLVVPGHQAPPLLVSQAGTPTAVAAGAQVVQGGYTVSHSHSPGGLGVDSRVLVPQGVFQTYPQQQQQQQQQHLVAVSGGTQEVWALPSPGHQPLQEVVTSPGGSLGGVVADLAGLGVGTPHSGTGVSMGFGTPSPTRLLAEPPGLSPASASAGAAASSGRLQRSSSSDHTQQHDQQHAAGYGIPTRVGSAPDPMLLQQPRPAPLTLPSHPPRLQQQQKQQKQARSGMSSSSSSSLDGHRPQGMRPQSQEDSSRYKGHSQEAGQGTMLPRPAFSSSSSSNPEQGQRQRSGASPAAAAAAASQQTPGSRGAGGQHLQRQQPPQLLQGRGPSSPLRRQQQVPARGPGQQPQQQWQPPARQDQQQQKQKQQQEAQLVSDRAAGPVPGSGQVSSHAVSISQAAAGAETGMPFGGGPSKLLASCTWSELLVARGSLIKHMEALWGVLRWPGFQGWCQQQQQQQGQAQGAEAVDSQQLLQLLQAWRSSIWTLTHCIAASGFALPAQTASQEKDRHTHATDGTMAYTHPWDITGEGCPLALSRVLYCAPSRFSSLGQQATAATSGMCGSGSGGSAGVSGGELLPGVTWDQVPKRYGSTHLVTAFATKVIKGELQRLVRIGCLPPVPTLLMRDAQQWWDAGVAAAVDYEALHLPKTSGSSGTSA